MIRFPLFHPQRITGMPKRRKQHMKMTVIILMCMTALIYAEKPLIAVADLEARVFTKEDALAVTDQLRSDLLNTGAVRVIERSQMTAILKEQGFQQSGCTNDECAVEVGQLLGVKYMLVGSIGSSASYTLLSVRILDIASGEILVNETIKNKGGLDNVFETGIAQMTKKLLTRFQGTAPVAAPSLPASNVTNTRRKHLPLIFGLGAGVLAGGGFLAYALLGKNNSDAEPSAAAHAPNVEMTIP